MVGMQEQHGRLGSKQYEDGTFAPGWGGPEGQGIPTVVRETLLALEARSTPEFVANQLENDSRALKERGRKRVGENPRQLEARHDDGQDRDPGRLSCGVLVHELRANRC